MLITGFAKGSKRRGPPNVICLLTILCHGLDCRGQSAPHHARRRTFGRHCHFILIVTCNLPGNGTVYGNGTPMRREQLFIWTSVLSIICTVHSRFASWRPTFPYPHTPPLNAVFIIIVLMPNGVKCQRVKNRS